MIGLASVVAILVIGFIGACIVAYTHFMFFGKLM